MSSNSDSTPVDERKRKRMQSNRESARRSRQRKQQRLDELLAEVEKLKAENEKVRAHIGVSERRLGVVEVENEVTRAELVGLMGRLGDLGEVIRFVGEFSGVEMEIPEIPDPLLKPWCLPFPAPAVLADAGEY